MPVDMFIEWPEGIVDLGIITKGFMEEYFILLENLMHENLYADILWLRLIDKYLINEFNLKRIKAVSWILYKKYDYGKLELVISVYVDDIFTARKQEI